ncbi:glutamate--cysteine ligase [Buchnera aphidicola (Acyrthosiphon lactucae)]|uniref:Glutamate--cysteine ligase n=1 Tax=Buchnera aphidicola (Acyrthosiphon lactucae) TaxID=1241832 RepID=A0A4D6XS62_9GAMM|nr:glutamate--cysteine ligase [Buchnera aphidicola]QCI17797.1 glutamate--cysteine ligase [Buchnera aphidicola (Acyrthosiphon lactucae)]
MIEDISKKIAWLKANPKMLKGIFRGIERETLRIQKNGIFSQKTHPYSIGSSLTHKWITTDFAENLLEFITPTSDNIDYLLSFLTDLHCFTASKIKNERMWPFSIPYLTNKKKNIQIAQYGKSNLGKMKNTYRIGLKNRYGDLINTISGVHYNFSLPLSFWENWNKNKNKENNSDYISSGYLHLIRNYYRFGWIIPYLFGSSPAISSCFLKNTKKKYKFKKNKENIFYLPWSTSLRLSDLGYTNTKILDLNIMFNDFHQYTESLKNALETPSRQFTNIGLKDIYGNFKQLNTNFLQIENELYTQIRPKRKTENGESLLEALKNRGIEYVEIRSLDINPFSPIGISKNQILLLDLFLIWCTLVDSPKINKIDFLLITKNWERIIYEGRKPNQKIYINTKKETKTLIEISNVIFKDLYEIALILDYNSNDLSYQTACKEIKLFFKNPDLTYSAQCLKFLIQKGMKKTGLSLANKYHKKFINENYLNINKKNLEKETIRSHQKQIQIEQEDRLTFEEYIKNK